MTGSASDAPGSPSGSGFQSFDILKKTVLPTALSVTILPTCASAGAREGVRSKNFTLRGLFFYVYLIIDSVMRYFHYYCTPFNWILVSHPGQATTSF